MRIAISGTHRAGKSTLAEDLAALLRDHILGLDYADIILEFLSADEGGRQLSQAVFRTGNCASMDSSCARAAGR
jgi:hypothetical protein